MNPVLIVGIVFLSSAAAAFSDTESQGPDSNRAGDSTRTVTRDADNSFENFRGISLSVSGGAAGTKGTPSDWQAIEVRMGKTLTDHIGLDFLYLNEAHLREHNHRDGFALQPTCTFAFGKHFGLELAAGPYFSMNTHNVEGVQTDDKQLGLLTSAAIKYYPNVISPHLSLRAGWDHAWVPRGIDTDSFLFGFGWDFGGPRSEERPPPPNEAAEHHLFEIGGGGAVFQTNRTGTSQAYGGTLEIQKSVTENVRISITGISEGTDRLVNRRGVAAQVWYEMPLDEKENWTVGAGAGPYFAVNTRVSHSPEYDGIISMEIARKIGRRVRLYLRYNRIADFKRSETDRDMGTLGVSCGF